MIPRTYRKSARRSFAPRDSAADSGISAGYRGRTGNKAGIVFKEWRNSEKKNRLLASIDKARRIFHYEPHTDFQTGLENVHAWFQENWRNIRKSAEF